MDDNRILQALKDELVRRAGVSLCERKGITALHQYIMEELGAIEHKEFEGEVCRGGDSISRKTLVRFFGKEKSSVKSSHRTLNILSRALGFQHLEDYKSHFTYSGRCLFDPSTIRVEKLQKDEIVTLGWPEEYFLKLRYLGHWEFEVLEGKGFHLSVGKKFTARWFQLLYCLTLNEHGEGYEFHPRIIRRLEPKKKNEEYIIY